MVRNSQEPRCNYWATRSSVYLFARTTYLFTCFALLALLARSPALICSLACSITPKLVGKRISKDGYSCSVSSLFGTIVEWRMKEGWLLFAWDAALLCGGRGERGKRTTAHHHGGEEEEKEEWRKRRRRKRSWGKVGGHIVQQIEFKGWVTSQRNSQVMSGSVLA